MRSFKIMYSAIFGVLLLSSCSRRFLDRVPESAISDAEFWKSSNDLRLYCNGFYSNFPEYMGFGNVGIYGMDADAGSDNMITMSYNTRLNGEVSVANAEGWDWRALRNMNYLLAHYGTVVEPWDNVKKYVGEALFFRSYFYFNMLRIFGDLPWVNKPLGPNSPEIYANRLPRNIIIDSVLTNLDDAISYLPSKSNQGAGRVSKEVAMALSSRIALYEGTWEKYHAGDPFGVSGSNGQKYLQKCVDISKALIDLGTFGLDNIGTPDGYWRLFNQPDYNSSKEIMFWRQYSVALGITHNWHRYTTSGAGRGLTKGLVDDYLCADGLPASVSPLYQGDDLLVTVVGNRDPRLKQTIYVNDGAHIITNNQPGAGVLYFTIPSFAQANEGKPATGYQVYKGHNPDYSQQSSQDIGTTGLILFRYAEVLLNYAEAKAELGALTQGDVDMTINKLRQRVGMPNLHLAAITPDPKWLFPGVSPAINEVRRERRVELACEGFRHDDIFRWAAADQLLKGWKPKGAKKQQWVGVVPVDQLASYPVDANGYIELYQTVAAMSSGYKFNPGRDYLWPIPLSELQVPSNTLTQNPNW